MNIKFAISINMKNLFELLKDHEALSANMFTMVTEKDSERKIINSTIQNCTKKIIQKFLTSKA